jgi:hypothetical protein
VEEEKIVVEMVKYMKAMLCEGMPFKNIPTTFYF